MRTRNCLLAVLVPGLAVAMAACASPSPILQAMPTLTNVPLPAATVAPTAPTPTVTRPSLNLHTVDWEMFIASDPKVDHPEFPIRADLGPSVAAKGFPVVIQAMGYALISKILYANFSDQGQEAAVIPIYDDGQTQNDGFLIYVSGNDAPVWVATLSGNNMLATIDGGQLVITQDTWGWSSPLDASGESRVSGHMETRYRLHDDRLVVVAQSSRGEPAYRRVAVEHFYESIRSKQFKEAYALLSPTFQSANPYDQWVEGYQNNVSFSITISDQANDLIAVEISSTDKTPTGHKPQSFKGTWSLIWNPTTTERLLDESNIVKVPLTGTRALDWTQIIATDPNLAHPDKAFNLAGLTGPLVASNAKDPSKGAFGFAMVDDIFYANIMGDPQEQVFIWLNGYPEFPECYGTIHNGLLIYQTNNGKPELATAIGGYDLSTVIHGDQLTVRDMVPTDFAFRGKCDTNGFRETHYRWQLNHLVSESFFDVSYGPEVIDAAMSFYGLLQAKEYPAAYALLSPAFQAVNPFDRWVAGYRNIISIKAGFSGDNGFVSADVASIEQTDSGQVTKHSKDKWVLIRDSKSKSGQWLLDQPENIPILQ